ncbi:MAG: hypothetical protein R3C45_03385 [Phycisphaerales bacterium]
MRFDLVVAAQLIGHPPAGDHQPVEVRGAKVAYSCLRDLRVAVLAFVRNAFLKPGDHDTRPRFQQTVLGVLQFHIFVVVADEDQYALAFENGHAILLLYFNTIRLSLSRRAVVGKPCGAIGPQMDCIASDNTRAFSF